MAVVEQQRKGIFSRPLDLVYLIYFATHIPVTLGIDFQVFYPPHLVPKFLTNALDMYIVTFKDPFMGSPTPVYWFLSFICAELVVQLPFFFIACVALVKDSRYIRLPLAVYGSHVATTVLPTITEVLLNPNYNLTIVERFTLCGFYAPYFLLPFLMMIDSCIRVNKYLNLSVEQPATKKSAKVQ